MTLLDRGPHWHLGCDADLTALWAALMGEGGFGERTLWLLFVDRESWTLPVIMPVDGLPRRPEPDQVDNLFNMVALLRDGDVEGFAPLLSRPGAASKTDDDRAWASQLTHTARARRIPMWPVHLATSGRVQVMAADDLIGA